MKKLILQDNAMNNEECRHAFSKLSFAYLLYKSMAPNRRKGITRWQRCSPV